MNAMRLIVQGIMASGSAYAAHADKQQRSRVREKLTPFRNLEQFNPYRTKEAGDSTPCDPSSAGRYLDDYLLYGSAQGRGRAVWRGRWGNEPCTTGNLAVVRLAAPRQAAVLELPHSRSTRAAAESRTCAHAARGASAASRMVCDNTP